MTRFIALAILAAFALPAFAGDKFVAESTPTQKTVTQKIDEPVVQKTATPVQKTETFATPVQKTGDPVVQKMETPVQKTETFAGPTQKGDFPAATQKSYGTAYELAEVPKDLLDRLRGLERQPCQPVRNLGRAIARNCIKKRIGQIIEDNLPPGPPLP